MMIISNKDGKKFEEDMESSANREHIWCFRVRDVFLPPDVRKRVKTPKNKYDFIFFNGKTLVPTELKSTKQKAFSFAGENPKIKSHQLKALTEDQQFKNIECGLLLNFREPEDRTFFIHINDFNDYIYVAENGLKNNYNAKINKVSIPLRICEEIGIEIKSKLKRTRHHYYLHKLFNDIYEKEGEK